jgi:hypothetical protein
VLRQAAGELRRRKICPVAEFVHAMYQFAKKKLLPPPESAVLLGRVKESYREGEMSGMQEEKETLYACGRLKERKGDDYCDPATIERDE